jgi:hypothetical protein
LRPAGVVRRIFDTRSHAGGARPIFDSFGTRSRARSTVRRVMRATHSARVVIAPTRHHERARDAYGAQHARIDGIWRRRVHERHGVLLDRAETRRNLRKIRCQAHPAGKRARASGKAVASTRRRVATGVGVIRVTRATGRRTSRVGAVRVVRRDRVALISQSQKRFATRAPPRSKSHTVQRIFPFAVTRARLSAKLPVPVQHYEESAMATKRKVAKKKPAKAMKKPAPKKKVAKKKVAKKKK